MRMARATTRTAACPGRLDTDTIKVQTSIITLIVAEHVTRDLAGCTRAAPPAGSGAAFLSRSVAGVTSRYRIVYALRQHCAHRIQPPRPFDWLVHARVARLTSVSLPHELQAWNVARLRPPGLWCATAWLRQCVGVRWMSPAPLQGQRRRHPSLPAPHTGCRALLTTLLGDPTTWARLPRPHLPVCLGQLGLSVTHAPGRPRQESPAPVLWTPERPAGTCSTQLPRAS